MKKQKTLLIVVLIVAIAMVGLYLAMGLMSGKEEKTGDDVKAVPMLTDMEDVTYVQYKNAEGTVTLVKADDKWSNEENTELVLVSGYVDEKVAELGKIEGELVADAVKAECGLEEPIYALTVKNAETEEKLVIGVSEDGVCYAMVDGKDDIYEIKEDVIDILNMNADDFSEPDGDMYSYFENLEEEDDTLLEEEIGGTGEDVVDDTTIVDDTVVEDTMVDDTTTDDTATEDTTTEE